MTETASPWDKRLAHGGLNAFDLARLVLATLVVLEHSYFLIENSAARDPLSILSRGQTNSGAVAVYMFFSLSGFLVTGSLLDSASIRSFMAKRIARIVPGFLAASLLGCVVVGALTSTADVGQYFHSQNWRNIVIEVLALREVAVTGILQGNPLQLLLGTLWTIQYEFDCYLILALLGALGLMRPKFRPVVFAAIAALLAGSMMVKMPVIDHGILALLISSPERWPELFPFFFVGSAFFLARRCIPKSLVLIFVSLAMIAISFCVGGVYWALLFGGTYAILFTSLSFSAQIRLFKTRVDLSYGVYLYGWPIQQMLLFYSGMRLSPLELFPAAIVLSYLTAWLSWTVVERPSLRLIRHHSW
jgi:peptidoglycan/LPS O-acetylase OafA/YrhL